MSSTLNAKLNQIGGLSSEPSSDVITDYAGNRIIGRFKLTSPVPVSTIGILFFAIGKP